MMRGNDKRTCLYKKHDIVPYKNTFIGNVYIHYSTCL